MTENYSALVRVVAFTHQGKVRQENEDTIAVGQWVRSRPMRRPELSLHPIYVPLVCLVADGMGGHAAGEIASRFVVEKMTDIAPIQLANEDYIRQKLKDVNKELFDLMLQDPKTGGMGTTIAGLVLTTENIFIFNVGDSRVYKELDGYLKRLTDDDSSSIMAPIYGDEGLEESRKSNLLSQCFGGSDSYVDILPHILKEKLSSNQRYLICSDGLSDMVDIDTMEQCLMDDDLDTVKNLFEKAISAGGKDNLSIMLIRTDLSEKENIEPSD